MIVISLCYMVIFIHFFYNSAFFVSLCEPIFALSGYQFLSNSAYSASPCEIFSSKHFVVVGTRVVETFVRGAYPCREDRAACGARGKNIGTEGVVQAL